MKKFKNKEPCVALAGVAQLVEYCPMYQKVTGSIPGHGTYPGFGLVPGQGTYVSLSTSPILSLFKKERKRKELCVVCLVIKIFFPLLFSFCYNALYLIT